MKALVCRQWGPPESLAIEDLPAPQPRAGQILVRVAAASAKFPEALMVQGKYQLKPPFPFIPGNEISGTVEALGEGVSGYAIGEAVMAQPGLGGFAEQVAVPIAKAMKIPAGMDLYVAAGYGLNYCTSYYALKVRAKLQPGETLLVLGAAGGVGLSAVEIGKMLGARVIACASSAEKLETCRRYGADELVNYEQEDLRGAIKRLTGDRGIDVAYDAVGDKFAEPTVRGMAWKGRYLVVGFAAGEIPRIALNLPLLKGSSIVGVFWGGLMQNRPQESDALFCEVTGLVASGRLKPLVATRFPLARAAEALRHLLERKAQGNVLVVNN